MKDSEDFLECCDNCPLCPCTKIYILKIPHKWAKRITRKIGCITTQNLSHSSEVTKCEYEECCDNCPSYPCISITNLDKEFGGNKHDTYDRVKSMTRMFGCIVNKLYVNRK
jgi:hypothetical protein